MHLCSRKYLHLPDRSKRRCICVAEGIFKVATEAKEDASAQPKVSPKWRQKQKKMHLRSRKNLQSGDRSKRRCICVAESISKAPKGAKEDASAQPKVSSKRQKEQKKMHLCSRKHLQSGDRGKRRCIFAAESIFKAPKEAKEDASGQPKVSPKWRQKQKRMHLRSSKASPKAKRSKRRCIYAAEGISKAPKGAKEDASA